MLLVRLLVLYNELAPVSSADQVISVPLWKFCRPWVTGYNDNVTCYLVVPSVPRTVSTTGHCIHVCIHVWQYVYIVTSLPVSNQLQIMCTIYIILTADHVYSVTSVSVLLLLSTADSITITVSVIMQYNEYCNTCYLHPCTMYNCRPCVQTTMLSQFLYIIYLYFIQSFADHTICVQFITNVTSVPVLYTCTLISTADHVYSDSWYLCLSTCINSWLPADSCHTQSHRSDISRLNLINRWL